MALTLLLSNWIWTLREPAKLMICDIINLAIFGWTKLFVQQPGEANLFAILLAWMPGLLLTVSFLLLLTLICLGSKWVLSKYAKMRHQKRIAGALTELAHSKKERLRRIRAHRRQQDKADQQQKQVMGQTTEWVELATVRQQEWLSQFFLDLENFRRENLQRESATRKLVPAHLCEGQWWWSTTYTRGMLRTIN